ncbi:SRPBCC family protein [Mycolicibacterium litorale]|uniref:SRPBCC family protein n=1 Tax=Mycolicibacterium litorale TaxID=758802 RepID=UPI003CFA16B2
MGSKQRTVEGSSPCSAAPERVWDVWTAPERWPGDVIEVGSVDGDFAVGSKVTVKVKGGVKTRSTLTRVEAPKIWTSVTTFPGLRLTYEHTIDDLGNGTVLTERVIMTGPFAGLFDRMTRAQLQETFVAVTAEIARSAESDPQP